MGNSTQDSIRKGVNPTNTTNIEINFNTDNSEAIRELAKNGKFGNNADDIVIFALRFLYTVHTSRPDANILIAEGPSGRTSMDI